MKNRIFFIGGASASGKSTIAKELSNLYALPVVELDRFYDILMQVIFDREKLVVATEKISLEVVAQFLAVEASCIIEGGWIQPKKANQLKKESKGHFYPVYCGYPTASVESRYLAIKKSGLHWLNSQSKKEARSFLISQIKESEHYRQECEQWRIEFFDFTEFSEGSRILRSHFEQWLRGG
jgi:shikimate kinase